MCWQTRPLFVIALLVAIAFAGSALAQEAGDAGHEELFRNKQFPSDFECKPCHEWKIRQ